MVIGSSSGKVPKDTGGRTYETLSHVRWNCKYHLVFISKCCHRTIYGEVKKKIGGIIRDLCRQKGIELHEGHAMPDHIHLLLSIPPVAGRTLVYKLTGYLNYDIWIACHANQE
ncbi:MAG: IS200/IS605 family transposase [Deltaproteobacteria bacterium]|nr:IS200/IS605 family transposase [Deltaproteobacteria bacterium]MBW2166191.1 IS200/IS605 family transposase [Deltaproteobacteria bacterium]